MFSIVNNTYKVKKMAQDNRNLLYIQLFSNRTEVNQIVCCQQLTDLKKNYSIAIIEISTFTPLGKPAT